MSIADEIATTLERLLAGPGSADDGALLLMRVRKAIEFHRLSKSMHRLQLFCDWNVHTELQRSEMIFEWLAGISIMMHRCADPQEKLRNPWSAFRQIAAEGLGLPQLRTELGQLLATVGTDPGVLTDDATWRVVRTSILHAIRDWPIGLPQDRGAGLSKAAKAYIRQLDGFSYALQARQWGEVKYDQIQAARVIVDAGMFVVMLSHGPKGIIGCERLVDSGPADYCMA